MNFLEKKLYKKQAREIDLLEKRLLFMETNEGSEKDGGIEAKQEATKQYTTAEDLIKLTQKAQETIKNESSKNFGTGHISGIIKGLPLGLSGRMARNIEDQILQEQGKVTGRKERIKEIVQGRILGLGTQRVADRLEARQKSKTLLEQERDKMIKELEDTHGWKTTIENRTRMFKKKQVENKETNATESDTTEDIILRAAKGLGSSTARFFETERRISYRQSGAKELQREIKALDKTIEKIGIKIEDRTEIFIQNKASKKLDSVRKVLKERAGISEEKFNEYIEKVQAGWKGNLPPEFITELKAKNMEDLIGPIRRAIKINKFGTFGTRRLRSGLGIERGNVDKRKVQVNKSVEQDKKVNEDLLKGKEKTTKIRELISKKEIIEGSSVEFTFEDKFMDQIELRTNNVDFKNGNTLKLIVDQITPKGIAFKTNDGKVIGLSYEQNALRVPDGYFEPTKSGMYKKSMGILPLGFTKSINAEKVAKKEVNNEKGIKLADKIFIEQLSQNEVVKLKINPDFKDQLTRFGFIIDGDNNVNLKFRNKVDNSSQKLITLFHNNSVFQINTVSGLIKIGNKEISLGAFDSVTFENSQQSSETKEASSNK